jgi:serine/threonine kinase 16
MAVLNAQYKQPANSAYSEGFRNLIDSMLKADPEDRPDIHGVSHLLSSSYLRGPWLIFC